MLLMVTDSADSWPDAGERHRTYNFLTCLSRAGRDYPAVTRVAAGGRRYERNPSSRLVGSLERG
jgi:hypothetical protein